MDYKNFTGTRSRVSWALFDWAGQAFHTLIVTFVFAVYFSQAIVGDEVRGQELWAMANAISGLAVAFLAPVIGAIADAGGPRKYWLLGFSTMAAISSAMLWWAEPNTAFIVWSMFWFSMAAIAFAFCEVFANSMLPDIAPADRIGRWSGWGWGMGYAGGLISIALALVFFVNAETPLLGLDKSSAEHVRMVGPFAAVWLIVFSVPLFLWTPDRTKIVMGVRTQIKAGLTELWNTIHKVRTHTNTVKFLIARMLYADGLATVFAVGGIYAAGVFGMGLPEVLLFGIVLNLTAGAGAFTFGWIDDYLGPKRTILIALTGLFVTATGALIVTQVAWFWFFGAALGVFVGPAQAASRSMMSRLSPPTQRTEFFGLYALTGKATAFLGPTLVAALTAATQSQRLGLSVLLVFIAAGAVLLLTVREPAA